MYIFSKTLQTIAWSSLAFSAARASYIIDNLSFGHKDGQPLSPNLRGIPHWAANGFDYSPEILSDRVILTPPWPGNRRGSLWSEDPLHHSGDWIAELRFRANGMERGQGNLQLWYTKDSQKVQTPNSLYTISKFDGLVLVIDQYEGRGGTIRGFLNDGNIDFKGHHSVDTLSFGQCNYAYRNSGEFSVLELKQANGELAVTVDGQPCFSTNKVRSKLLSIEAVQMLTDMQRSSSQKATTSVCLPQALRILTPLKSQSSLSLPQTPTPGKNPIVSLISQPLLTKTSTSSQSRNSRH